MTNHELWTLIKLLWFISPAFVVMLGILSLGCIAFLIAAFL